VIDRGRLVALAERVTSLLVGVPVYPHLGRVIVGEYRIDRTERNIQLIGDDLRSQGRHEQES